MRKLFLLLLALVLTTIGLTLPPAAGAQSDSEQPVVQAVLFYSPSCPHCHDVIQNLLVPLIDEYGDQLQIIGVDTSQPEGGQLYQIAIEHYQIPQQRRGVPTLIVGDVVLVGSGEIPAEFPTLVDDFLAEGGIGWPDMPGFAPEIASEEAETTAEPQPETAAAAPAESEPEAVIPTVAPTGAAVAAEDPAPAPQTEEAAAVAEAEPASIAGVDEEALSTEPQAPPPDPVGMSLASLVLAGMVAALLFAVWRMVTGQSTVFDRNSPGYAGHWLIPALSLVGLGVSIYLAYVEISHVEAVCGPVGHCNLVQSSVYAQILGIPIAVLGMLNYVAIIILWAGQRVKPLATLSALALLGLTLFGTLFSIYLTLLEIFVIRAVCAWCLSSAIITTLLLLLVVIPVTKTARLKRAYSH